MFSKELFDGSAIKSSFDIPILTSTPGRLLVQAQCRSCIKNAIFQASESERMRFYLNNKLYTSQDPLSVS